MSSKPTAVDLVREGRAKSLDDAVAILDHEGWMRECLELRAENERLNVYAHKIEEEARQSTFENERLRYALELIADCDCPDCEDAAAVAREALARDRR